MTSNLDKVQDELTAVDNLVASYVSVVRDLEGKDQYPLVTTLNQLYARLEKLRSRQALLKRDLTTAREKP
jgi:hypothetical protein